MQQASTTVVNVKRDDCDVYIGRAMPGRDGSTFANPFRIGVDGRREDVLAKYEAWLTRRLSEEPALHRELEQLRGKRLGCWCKPHACHGDLLVRLLHPQESTPVSPEQPGLF